MPELKKQIIPFLTLVFLLLSSVVISLIVTSRKIRLGEIRIGADVPETVIVKSEQAQGLWKEVDFDSYEGCPYSSATDCTLARYPIDDGWTEVVYDDTSWEVKDFTVSSSFWSEPGWNCHQTYFSSDPTAIGPSSGFSGINGLTALHRRVFELSIPADAEIAYADLRLWSDNKTAAYINGQLLTENDEGCYLKNISDPSSLLKNGDNVIAIQSSNDWVSNQNNPMGLRYELTITLMGCNDACDVYPCPEPYECVDVEGSDLCRHPDCPEEPQCVCTTPTLTPTPTVTPTSPPECDYFCTGLTAYDEDWNPIDDLDNLPLQKLCFEVEGWTDCPEGITEARFRIDEEDWEWGEFNRQDGEYYYYRWCDTFIYATCFDIQTEVCINEVCQ